MCQDIGNKGCRRRMTMLALNPSGFSRSRRLLCICGFLYLFGFLLLFPKTIFFLGDNFRQSNIPVGKRLFGGSILGQKDAYGDAIRAIYQPMKLLATDPSFKDPIDDRVYNLPSHEPAWKTRMGSDLCIVEIDSRNWEGQDQLLNPRFDISKVRGVSAGMLNRYTYAKIHGYDYKFVHTSKWPKDARDDPWLKVTALRELLKSYRMVVVLDADAIFRHVELPFEWLLNRWNYTSETSLAMALDVGEYIDGEGNKKHYGATLNKYGDLNPNTGFIIAQNLPRTFEILDAWISCPDNEAEFPGCDHFRHGWPCEQGAFGEHIVYQFNRSTDFLPVSCDDGMGYPGQGFGCEGRFVTHYTTAKDQVKEGMMNSLLQGMFLKAHGELRDTSSGVRVEMQTLDSVKER